MLRRSLLSGLLLLWGSCLLLIGGAVVLGQGLPPGGLALWMHNRRDATRWTLDMRTRVVQPDISMPIGSLPSSDRQQWIAARTSLGMTTFELHTPRQANPTIIGSYDVTPAIGGIFWEADNENLLLVDSTGSQFTRFYRLTVPEGDLHEIATHSFRSDDILAAPDLQHVLLRNQLTDVNDSASLLVDVQTGDAVSLPPIAGAAAWSASGRWLAYATEDDFFMVDMHAPTLADRIASTRAIAFDVRHNPQALRWSPATATSTKREQLAATGNGVHLLTAPDFTPQRVYHRGGLLRGWSPDGCCLVLDTRSESDVFAPHLLQLATGDIQQLQEGRISAFSRAVWSADSAYVAIYQSDPIQGHELLVYRPGDTIARWRTTLSPDAYPNWLVDERYAVRWR